MTKRQMGVIRMAMTALAVGWASTASASASDAQKCEAAKLGATAKYAACRLGAEKKGC